MFIIVEKICNYIEYLLKTISTIFLFSVTINVIAQVLFRLILPTNAPVWTEELARFSLVWACLFTLPVVTRRGMHVAMKAVYDVFDSKYQRILDFISMIACSIFLIIMIRYGFILANRFSVIRAVTLPISTKVVFMAIPISSFLTLIFLLERFFIQKKNIKGVISDME